jgi:signal transduction histidine kinase
VIGKRSARYVVAVYLAIAAVSVLHYVAPPHAHQLHDIYRRLYYLPIIVAAFLHGWKGGILSALVVCAAYAPHAFGHISHDPASDTQKILEMLLYFAVGLTTGSLVSVLKRTQRELQGSIEQLRSTEAELVQTARLAAVGRLSAGLAHEIRNPLASIKGSAEILADDFPPDHKKRRLLEVLIDESNRLNNVLTRFLAFARPRPIEPQIFDAQREVEAVVSLLQSHEQARGVTIEVLPAVGDCRVRGDREQLRQVFLNVLLNASQAAGGGGRVRISFENGNGTFRLRVHDPGAGFTPEALENAFTPFFTTKKQGTGLGLAISHRIIESHGGRIRVGNHPEGGGLVEVEVPLSPAADEGAR